jgi:hypothetical protein
VPYAVERRRRSQGIGWTAPDPAAECGGDDRAQDGLSRPVLLMPMARIRSDNWPRGGPLFPRPDHRQNGIRSTRAPECVVGDFGLDMHFRELPPRPPPTGVSGPISRRSMMFSYAMTLPGRGNGTRETPSRAEIKCLPLSLPFRSGGDRRLQSAGAAADSPSLPFLRHPAPIAVSSP